MPKIETFEEDIDYTVKWVTRNLRNFGDCYVGKKCPDELIMKLTLLGYNVIKRESEMGILLKLLNRDDVLKTFKN